MAFDRVPDVGSPDAALGDTPLVDAPSVDGPLGVFGPAVALALNTSATEDDPSLTSDLLAMYFDSDRAAMGAGLGDCWVATRASATEPWGAASLVTELASPADDSSFDISPDGLTMYFASARGGTGDSDIYVSTRADRTAAWSAPVRVVEIASPSSESSALETADGLQLYFVSNRSGSPDIYVATRAARGQAWAQITPIPALSDPDAKETEPWINPDATLIVFAANYGQADTDIYFASRPSPEAQFSPPQRLPGAINTSAEEADPWLSPDLKTLYFSRNGGTSWDMFMATR